MPAPNRNRYSDDYGGGSSAIRTLGAFLLCAVLSFALGFFVLARFWSSKPKGDADGLEKNAVAMAGDHSLSLHGNDTPVPQRTALPSAQPAPRAAAPRIDPAQDDVQKPASLDENRDTPRPTDPGQDNLTAPPDETTKSAETTPTDPPAPTDPPKPKKHKKLTQTDDTQASKAPDEEAAPPDSTDDVNDVKVSRRKRPAAAVAETTGGLYRVQIGVYSTREKAEEQAKNAADKGFETTIHTVTNGDRTFYRVQHSAHRNRTNAENEKQRLVDAGFDAYIANP
ncbi:MAG: Polysaccharide deacetylase [Chthonomonadaceae bacterium]|nr:Polysaccharide deacetylase [Chthonomonadaceae bacterium]